MGAQVGRWIGIKVTVEVAHRQSIEVVVIKEVLVARVMVVALMEVITAVEALIRILQIGAHILDMTVTTMGAAEMTHGTIAMIGIKTIDTPIIIDIIVRIAGMVLVAITVFITIVIPVAIRLHQFTRV